MITNPYGMVYTNIIASLAACFIFVFYRFIFPKRKINFLACLIIISIPPIISIFRPGTYQSGDLTLHSVFLQSFYENLRDGILVPRWAGGLCGGYGCPVFMFEYVMPFYIGSVFHFLGFSFINSIKLFLASAYILSGVTMFIFLKEHFKDKSAFIGTLLYLFAPVRFIEMHFRVSVGTDAAFIFIPLTFYFVKKSLEKKYFYILLGAINFLFLILSHSSITFVVVPLSLIYGFLIKKRLKDVIYSLISLILGLSLSAYYVLPAIFELKYTWYSLTIQKITEFYSLMYYLISPARFGLLFQGNNGELRLIVGYAQIFVVLIAVYFLLKKKFKLDEKKITVFLLVSFAICFSLMLSFTEYLWNHILFLRSFVLPWRMLVPIAFITAFLGSLVTKTWRDKYLILLSIVIVLVTILNWGNRQMVTEDPNAYQKHWSLYSEYLKPNDNYYQKRYLSRVSLIPDLVLNRPSAKLEISSGKGMVKQIERKQNYHAYLLEAQTNVKLIENTFYFPGWEIYSNNKKISFNIEDKKAFGRIVFNVPKGLYLIKAKFDNTPIRNTGDYISILTIFVILLTSLYLVIRKKSKD